MAIDSTRLWNTTTSEITMQPQPSLSPEITLPALTPEEYRLLCECVRVANVGMAHVELAVALKQKLQAPLAPSADAPDAG